MKNKDNKNKDRLDSFVRYCKNYPEQRFWQALRNWTYEEYKKEIDNGIIPTPSFIFLGMDYEGDTIQDTFYLD